MLPARTKLGNCVVEPCYFCTEHVRLVVDRDRENVLFFLIFVQRKLAVFEIGLQIDELALQPVGRHVRRLEHLVEVVFHVGVDESR